MAFKKKNNDNVNFGNPNLQNGMQNMQNNMQNSSMGAPKVKKERLQNVSKYSRTRSVLIMLALVVVGVLVLNFISTMSLKKTVTVVSLSSAVPQDGLIKSDIMVPLEMTEVDYERQGVVTLGDVKRKAIVLWDEREQINNTYASYYIRQGTPVYWDAVSGESPKQYSYLYNMDGELLKISINADTFGQMLVPGDRINVRAAYSEQVFTLPTEEEFMMQQQTGISPQTTVKRQILLFNNVAILDMLNGNGESIFDKYYELLSLPKDEQSEVINSEEFIAAVQPAEILLNVTPEEADRYMSIQANGPTYMMTLLPRTSSNAITEVLNELAVGFARKD